MSIFSSYRMQSAKFFYSVFLRRVPISFALILLGIAGWLTIILSSYHEYDCSLFAYKSGVSDVANMGGVLGAHVSAFLIYACGCASFVIIWLLCFISYMLLAQRSFKQEFDRLIALMVLFFASSALCTRFSRAGFGVAYSGGLLGYKLYRALVFGFAEPAATLILLAVSLCCCVVVIRAWLLRAVQGIIFMFGWLAQHKQLFVVAWRWTCAAAYWITTPVRWLTRRAVALFRGETITHASQSIVEFEKGIVDHDARAITEDEFWRTFLTDIATQHECGQQAQAKDAVSQHLVKSEKKINTKEIVADKIKEKQYSLPPHTLLGQNQKHQTDKQTLDRLQASAKLLEEKLAHFGISGSVVSIKCGPVVTLFEYQPDINARISKITALDDDLALALQALSIRIIAPIPGKSVIGFEVSNKTRSTVYFHDIVRSSAFAQSTGLPLAIGVDTIGNHVVVDLARMPHVLIAGSTGSGKSVALHTMIMSLLFKHTPDDLNLILIDPKRLEFSSYKDIAHLVFPIVMQPQAAIPVLKWVVAQMEQRYEIMTEVGARNINDYHALCKGRSDYAKMPYMVVIIDELADLMMTCGRDIEDLIARIAQMARAAGIHMILATQRPSVDVITGLIKVNIPSRISCRVTSKVDSRTILDCNGAEKLLGRGDMLFLDSADSSIKRVHGAYVSDAEIAAVVRQIRVQRPPHYLSVDDLVAKNVQSDAADDVLFDDVLAFLKDVDEVSISLLQRRFRIGFNRSARIIETLEAQGFIAPSDGGKVRKVLRQ